MIPNRYLWEIVSQKDPNTSIIEHLLKSRNIVESQKFLYPDIADLSDPFLFSHMDKGVKRIIEAIKTKERIIIYGDYDVDGITSTATLYMFLSGLEANVDFYVPNRITEGYGLNINAINEIEASLIITVDNGITAIKEIEVANERGIDVIVTDHHTCLEELPAAYCIINHMKPSCMYPSPYLCGVGVVFQLIKAIAMTLNLDLKDHVYKYLDLVAIGTIADIVPLKGDNRILVSVGLKLLNSTQNIGLYELIRIANNGRKKELYADDVAFQLAPRINAISRISDAKLGIELLITKDLARAKELANLLEQTNKQRKEMEQTIYEEAIKYVEEQINLKKDKIIIVLSKGWPHGIIGLIASKIVKKYYRPTIISTLDADGMYTCSGRSVEDFSIVEAIIKEQHYLNKFGGHTMAAGLTIDQKNMEQFKEDINRHNADNLTKKILTPKVKIDLEVSISDITISFYKSLCSLEPFGASNPKPILKVCGIIVRIQSMGATKDHIKITLSDHKDHFLEVIAFFNGQLIDFLNIGEHVEVAGSISLNEWNGKVSVQFLMDAIRSPIDIEQSSKYYLNLYENFKNSIGINLENLSYDELTLLIPSYEDCVKVFSLLKRYNSQYISLNKITFSLSMNEYKVLQITDIFCELGFLSYNYIDNRIYYTIKHCPKTKLENSSRFNLLNKFLKGE
ncbi:MAG: single-stranded-DNA-specific exonuclease RecJ [Candidatus Epulonipiscioides saccharophilum]|nr:MAG: single-stranded-DNA-specific exonuclease RecJ [Epulopiscium sp. AS2M-Bin001]